MENVLETREITPDWIRAMAKEMKVTIPDLLALDQNVDPFYATGGKAKTRNGQWAYHWWKELGKPKIHGRAFNYALMGKAHLPHNNVLYDGSDKHYSFSRRALELARYQGLIPYEKIPDHKTRFHANFYTWEHEDINKLVDFNVDYEWIVNKVLKQFASIWYPYLLQDTVCEAWIEKSSIVETVEPILNSYKANYIEGEGDISLTRCWEFVGRVITYYKELGISKFRVFYISDFDPVGISMPVSMARKVEYLLYKMLKMMGIPYGVIDVRVEDIVVTPEQVEEFGLKPTKVPEDKITAKDGSKRRTAYATRVADFKRIFGVVGVVELEALTITEPKEVPRVLRERLSRYYDKEVDRWIKFEHGRIKTIIRTILDNVDWNDLPQLGELRIDWKPLVDYVETVEPPEAHHNESSDWGIFWLLESRLDYAEQLLRYSQFKLNQKTEVIAKEYPKGERPEPAERKEGISLSDEEFEQFLEQVAEKQHKLREIKEVEESKELDDSYFMDEEE